jgi:hypothetical protein
MVCTDAQPSLPIVAVASKLPRDRIHHPVKVGIEGLVGVGQGCIIAVAHSPLGEIAGTRMS